MKMVKEVSFKYWPIVWITFNKSYKNNEELDIFLKKLEKAYTKAEKQNHRCIFFFDTSKIEYVDPSIMIKYAKWMKEIKPKTAKYVLCSSVVVDNDIIRNLLKVFFLAFTPSRPHYISKNYAEAFLTICTHWWAEQEKYQEKIWQPILNN